MAPSRLGVVAIVAVAFASASPSIADPAQAAGCAQWRLAIGAPGERVAGMAGAGAVELRDSDGTATLVTPPDPQSGARFGSAIQGANLDGDACTDLVVGAPGASVGAQKRAGAVYAFLNGTTGLQHAGTWTVGSNGVPGAPHEDAGFGSSVSVFNAPGDGGYRRHIVAVGAPGESVGTARAAGVLVQFTLEHGTLDPVDPVIFNQDSASMPGGAESGDRFGQTLSLTPCIVEGDYYSDGYLHYIVGAPGEAIGSLPGAGAVNSFAAAYLFEGGPEGSNNGRVYLGSMWSQNSSGMAGSAEANDHFGAAVAGDLVYQRVGAVIGVPDEDIGNVRDAGMINRLRCKSWGLVAGDGASQDSAGMSGAAEAGDHFGAAVSTSLAGVPGEDVGNVVDAGMVNNLGTGVGLTQNTGGVPGVAEAGDLFGAAIDPYVYPSAVVGAPGEDGKGAVIVLGNNPVEYKQTIRRVGDGYGSVLF